MKYWHELMRFQVLEGRNSWGVWKGNIVFLKCLIKYLNELLLYIVRSLWKGECVCELRYLRIITCEYRLWLWLHLLGVCYVLRLDYHGPKNKVWCRILTIIWCLQVPQLWDSEKIYRPTKNTCHTRKRTCVKIATQD